MAEREIKVNIGGDTSGLDGALTRSQQNLIRFAKVGAAAVAAVGVALVGLTSTSLSNIDALTKQARSLGLTTAALQKMSMVAGEAGIDTGKLSGILGIMQRNVIELEKGTKLQADAFGKLGLSIKDLQGLSPDEQFRIIAESLDQITDPATKTAAAMDIFGRSGRAAINMLAGYSDKVKDAEIFQKKFGITVSQFDAERIEAANDAVGRVSMAFQGLGNILAAKVAPLMIRTSEAILTGIEHLGDGIAIVGIAIFGLAATQIPALVAAGVAYVATMGAGAIATGVLTVAVNALRFAWIALGGPIGVIAGIVGTLGAAWLVYGRQSKVGEDAIYDTAEAEAALRAEMEGLATISSPAAREEAILRIQTLKEHAAAALTAAQAELAVAQAMQEARLADAPEWIKKANADGVLDIPEVSGASARVAEMQANLDKYMEALALLNNSGGGIARVEPTGLGGGSGSGLVDRITALQESLMTETELLTEWYETSATALDDALEADLLKHDEHKEAKLRLDEEYRRRSAEINSNAAKDELAMKKATVDGVIGLITNMGTRSKALAKVAVALNAAKAMAETAQNTASAQMRALAELGPIAGAPIAAKIGAYGAIQMGIIGANAALSLSGGGRGGSGGGGSIDGSATTAAPAQQQATTFAFTIQNDPMGFGESFARQMIEQLNEAQRNGGQVRGVLA
jgi:hypothetical protein